MGDAERDQQPRSDRIQRIRLATSYYVQGKSIVTIAEIMETSETRVREWLAHGLADHMLGSEAIPLIRARQAAQLADVTARVLRLVRALDDRLVTAGQDDEPAGEPPSPEPMLRAIDRFVRLSERQSALAGLDAATKIQASVNDGLPADARLQQRLHLAQEALAERERVLLAETEPETTS
jgi:hypothetical protein